MTVATISQNTGATYAGATHTTVFEIFSGTPQTDGYAAVLVIQSETGNRRHSTLTFGGLSNIPSGATITSASLTLTCTGGSGVSESMSIYRLLVPHAGRSIETWDNRDTAIPWTSDGGNNVTDRSSSSAATAVVTSSSGEVATFTGAGLVSLVQGWVSGSMQNYGMLVAQTDEALIVSRYINFSSPDNTTQGPVLTVTYTAAPSFPSASNKRFGNSRHTFGLRR